MNFSEKKTPKIFLISPDRIFAFSAHVLPVELQMHVGRESECFSLSVLCLKGIVVERCDLSLSLQKASQRIFFKQFFQNTESNSGANAGDDTDLAVSSNQGTVCTPEAPLILLLWAILGCSCQAKLP